MVTLLSALLLVAAGDPLATTHDEPKKARALILKADLVVTGDGEAIKNGSVLLRGDRILAVGADVPQPNGSQVVELHGVLAPGFVDAFNESGADGPIREGSRNLAPDLRAADAVDRDALLWKEMLAQGVTSIHLLPEPRQVAAGWGAMVQTAGSSRIQAEQTRQLMCLAPNLINNRILGPTSLVGGFELLDGALSNGVEGLKERGALIYVLDAEGVRGAQESMARHEYDAAWYADGDLGEYGGLLQGQLVGIPTFEDYSWSNRRSETLRRLHAAGTRFAIGGRDSGGNPSALRTSAMALSRILNDPNAALAAITTHAAELAGQKQLGRLAPRARADLVLWSAHPLDATASVKAVMIGGETVYSAAQQEDSSR